jgi:transposase
MSSIVNVKNPNGTTYIYENTTIWDKEKKKHQHHRKVIGKILPDGTKVMYPKDDKVLTPKLARAFGHIFLLNEISKKIGLSEIIRKVFNQDFETITTLSHYMICQDSSLSNCPKWMEMTDVLMKTPLSSQRISEMLKRISDEKILMFFKEWVKHRLEHEYVAFDITSISSYSELIELVEFGYNRDKEKLPQINLGMFFGEESMLPIFYNIYPGSIKDVKTLNNMLVYTDVLNIEKIKYVMDKGFYSDSNITDLIKAKKKFTIAVPFKNAKACKAVQDVKDTIHSPSNALCDNELIFGKTMKLTWECHDDNGSSVSTEIYQHVIYDDDKRNEMENRLMSHVMKLKAELEVLKKLPKNTTRYDKYFQLEQLTDQITITIKDDVIRDELKYEGYMVVFSNDLSEIEQVFKIYRRKDVIEKAFDNLKNDLDVKRLKVHNVHTLRGKIFIAFISLIIKSHIFNVTNQSALSLDYATNEVIREMQKISLIKFSDDKEMLTEITATQKKICNAFDITVPTLK